MNKFTSISIISSFTKAFLWIVLMLLFTQQLMAQCSVTCQQNIEITIFGREDLRINPQMVLTNPDENCTNGVYNIEIFSAEGHSLGDIVNYEYIGEALAFKVTETTSNNSCEGNMVLLDEFAPELSCNELFVPCHADVSPDVLGYPAISDNIDELTIEDLEYEDRITNLNCLAEREGQRVTQRIEREWFVKDASGNEGYCSQTIYLKRAELIDIQFPAPLDDNEKPSLSCSDDDPNDLDLTGRPMIDGQPLVNNDICDFSVDFHDRFTDYCEGSYQILRFWSVIDLCTAEERKKVQIIEVKDKTAPTISCPDTIRVAVSPANCKAEVTLLQPEVSDNCAITTTLIQWEYGTGIGPFTNVAYGEHIVSYSAKDACGNESQCKSIVIVEDTTRPTTLCDDGMEISLTDTGNVIAEAEIFDNGSHDNCAIVKYEVSRAGGEFVESLVFDCEDVANSPIPLTFRVTDIDGSFSECEMEVNIADKDAPVITCPADMTIKCSLDYQDVNITGEATATDACGLVTITYNDEEQLNQCGLGTVIRTWQVADNNGNVTSCQQTITLEMEGEIEVIFPENVELFACNVEIDADSLGRPIINGSLCGSDFGIDYTDNVFGDSPPACYTIYRRWTVVDLCQHVPNSNNPIGFWEATQIIEVYDTIAPVVNCFGEKEVSIFNGGCEIFVELDIPTSEDCSPDITYTNNSPYADDNGANASGVYPVGEHTIIYTATDGCGNSSTCQLQLLVRDEVPPTPVCLNGVTIPLDEQGQTFVTPNMVTAGVVDNCFAKEEIELTVTPNRFDCNHVGTQEITVRAEDPMGNFATCIVAVTIQDNINNCTDTADGDNNGTADVRGSIRSSNGEEMNAVPVQINNSEGEMLTTNEDGSYQFSELPMDTDYTIRPVSVMDYANGVTTFDLIKIRKHILGTGMLTDPYQLIAGDVNNSGNISTFDMVTLRKLILGVDDQLANHPSWVFVSADYEFPNDMNPANAPYPQIININNLNSNHSQADFVAVKIGDINGSASTDFTGKEIEERGGRDDFNFLTENKTLAAGYTYEVPVYAQDFKNIEGFQLTFDYNKDNLEWIGMQADALPRLTKDHFYEIEKGQLTLSWEYFFDTAINDETPLFTLLFNAHTNSTLEKELKLTSSRTRAEAYTYDEKHLNLNLLFTESTRNLNLLQNIPNPFRDDTTIRFQLPTATEVTLTIYDLHGHQIQQHHGHFSAGKQSIDIHLENSTSQGILYYTLTTPITKTISGKMLRIKE